VPPVLRERPAFFPATLKLQAPLRAGQRPPFSPPEQLDRFLFPDQRPESPHGHPFSSDSVLPFWGEDHFRLGGGRVL